MGKALRLSRRQSLISGLALAGLAASPTRAEGYRPLTPDLRKRLERGPAAPVLGNPEGDASLIEFFDYNCPFCRKMEPAIAALIGEDPKLRLICRQWAIFGEGSVFAAKAALAAVGQGAFPELHAGLMGMAGRAEEVSVMALARRIGLDPERLRRDMDAPTVAAELEATDRLAREIRLIGTPSVIAGTEVIFGDLPLEELRDLVARARKAAG